MLAQHYGIHDAALTPIEHGHTNASFGVEAGIDRYVLRRAWEGKPATQIADEEHVLAHLFSHIGRHDLAPFDVPRVVPATSGATHAIVDGRVHHVFRMCRGDSGPRYLAPGDHARIRSAMTRLAQLHRGLAEVPLTPGEPWLHARLARIRTGPPGVEQVLSRIGQILPAATTMQWVHGDYHLSNLLWSGDEVVGVVDFDDVARGSAALEAGMALFALARQPAGEDALVYDAELWDVGRAAYDGPVAGDALLFCAYQVLIHLDGAQRGLWQLTDGIGFWPCWHTVMGA